MAAEGVSEAEVAAELAETEARKAVFVANYGQSVAVVARRMHYVSEPNFDDWS